MLANEYRGLEIFLESATFENDFRPLSYSRIAKHLEEEEYAGSKSAVGRWAKKWKWDDRLAIKRQEAVMVLGGDDSVKTKALIALDEITKVTVERNSVLIADGYDIMENFTLKVKMDMARGIYNRDDIKLAKDMTVLVTGREDKMLDRLAGEGGERLSSQEVLEELDAIDVEIDDE